MNFKNFIVKTETFNNSYNNSTTNKKYDFYTDDTYNSITVYITNHSHNCKHISIIAKTDTNIQDFEKVAKMFITKHLNDSNNSYINFDDDYINLSVFVR